MSLIHLVEGAFLALLTVPYAMCSLFWGDKKRTRFSWLLVYAVWIVSIHLGVLIALFQPIANPHGVVDYKTFVSDFFTMWKIYLGAPSILASIALPIVIQKVERERSLWICIAAAFGSVLGSYNPILYPIFSRLMTSQLAWRTLMLFPSALILGVLIAGIWFPRSLTIRRSSQNKWQKIGSAGALFGTVALYLFTLWGVDGSASYFWSDRFSQLKLYPKLYEFVSTQHEKIFLGDPFTSVPIPAISSNFATSHRPWNNADGKRQDAHLTITEDFTTPNFAQTLDTYKVDFVLVNENPPPRGLEAESLKYPALYRFSRPAPTVVPSNIVLRGTFDGVKVYEVRRP